MTRVKRGTIKRKRKNKILALTKGFRNARSTKFRQAKQALIRAGQHAFNHRRQKKADFRQLWQIKISAATKQAGLSYSKFIDLLTKKKVGINRKMLADLAENKSETFNRIIEEIK